MREVIDIIDQILARLVRNVGFLLSLLPDRCLWATIIVGLAVRIASENTPENTRGTSLVYYKSLFAQGKTSKFSSHLSHYFHIFAFGIYLAFV